MVLAFLFGLAFASLQLAGLGLTAVKVSHAAQEAAYVAASTIKTGTTGPIPCWAVTGGPQNPGDLADAAVCKTVMENLGNADAADVSIRVSPARQLDRQNATPITVTVTYREEMTSPLLRLLIGPTFTTTGTASSWSR